MDKQNSNAKKSCFVISPIGKPESTERKNSDLLLKYIITPVMEITNYDARRADQISDSGIITKQIIRNLIDSKLVIADLTGHNPNVLYELAIRHAIKKPFIHLIKKGEQIPFDIVTTRIIFYYLDLDSVDAAKKELKKTVDSSETSQEMDNPIADTLVLKSLTESQNPKERSLAELVEAISNMKSTMNNWDNKFDAHSQNLSVLATEISHIIKTRNSDRDNPFMKEILYELTSLSRELMTKLESTKSEVEILRMAQQIYMLIRDLSSSRLR